MWIVTLLYNHGLDHHGSVDISQNHNRSKTTNNILQKGLMMPNFKGE